MKRIEAENKNQAILYLIANHIEEWFRFFSSMSSVVPCKTNV